MMRIVIVEDDLKLQNQMVRFLAGHGNEVAAFADAVNALEHLRNTLAPDVLLCDFRLGDQLNGLALAKQTRSLHPACAIVMISAYANREQVAAAVRLEIDDFLIRPVRLDALLRHLHEAVDRRLRTVGPRPSPAVESGPLRLDAAQKAATWDGKPLHLTRTEFTLLAALAREPGTVLSHIDLWAAVSGERTDRARARTAVKQHIHHLRQKLEQVTHQAGVLINVRGEGYKLVVK